MKTRIVLCGILMAAAIPFHARAGTLFYVPIPAAGSDAQSGIAPANVYSSAIAAGNPNVAGRTVNGVNFGTFTGTGNTRTGNGVTLSAATGSLTNGGGKADSIQADGAMAELLSGMIFNDGADDDSEQYVVLDPATLTAGKTYDLRVYMCNGSGENRQVSLSFEGDGKAALSTDFFNQDDATTSPGGFIEPNQVYYINYRFTWDGVSTPGFTATQRFGSTPFCLYALTNQEIGGDADARPADAVVAAQPDLIAAPPVPRGTRTAYVQPDDDIGVSSDVFYNSDSLRRHGRWVRVGTYGRCWQPIGVDRDWQPYTRGRWVHSRDDGWVWDSDEDFGWATYHYGRWFREEDSGWYWVPGRVWAPAWVSWRHGHSHIGWAPLPPPAVAVVGLGISSWADHRWGIGPRAYNFVNMRDFGARSMSGVLVPRQQNVTIMTNTTNVTNIVNNRTVIYNGGPNFQAVNNALVRTGGQPIPAVRVNRNPGQSPLTPDGKFSQLNDGVLAVTAPAVTKSKKSASLPAVAATIAAPKFDKGWSGLADAKNAAALQAKIAKETPGQAAKSAPARLPGTVAAAPGGVGAKATDKLKPSPRGKPADSALVKPGQPLSRTAAPLIKPGQPAPAIKGATLTKPGRPADPSKVRPPEPGQPVPPTTDDGKKPGKPPKPATVTVPQPVTPVTPPQPGLRGKSVDAPVIKPGKSVKPTTLPPTQPVPPSVKTPVPEPPTPESIRSKRRTPLKATTIPSPPSAKPAIPATSQPEPNRAKKRAPQSIQPVPAPVRVAPPAPAVARPAPLARPNPQRAVPVPAPVSPPPPSAPPTPLKKGGKPIPTPTPVPGVRG